MAAREAPWGANTEVSMPVPTPADAGDGAPMGGMVFTPAGLFHDLSEVDREELLLQGWGPERWTDG
jgi:hypothetical protein